MTSKRSLVEQEKFFSADTVRGYITLIEGIAHTLVTPVVEVLMCGDYSYQNGSHNVTYFHAMEVILPASTNEGQPDNEEPEVSFRRQGRKVLISAAVPMNFERPDAMIELCRVLREWERVGDEMDHTWKVLDNRAKQMDAIENKRYERQLLRHMRLNLLHDKAQAGYHKLTTSPWTFETLFSNLYTYIMDPYFTHETVWNKYFALPSRAGNGHTISLEILFNVAVHQLRNELSVLEACCPQGYVYTHKLSERFSTFMGSTHTPILDRLMILALKHFASTCHLTNMRVFAYYAEYDTQGMDLLQSALTLQPHVQVVELKELFPAPTFLYKPPENCEKALLVLHTDTAAFEEISGADNGTCHGLIAKASSAAASFSRFRPDLLSYIM